MLEGLEISEIGLSALERTGRLDSQFYACENLVAMMRLLAMDAKPLTAYATVSDGNHMGISEQFVSDENAIPYYRGSDIYNLFIERAVDPMRIDDLTFRSPQMARSHLKRGDVLMSIVGAIIGNVSFVSEQRDASCSCKLAILRPHAIQTEMLSMFLTSYFGQLQVQRFKRGAAQTGLILEDFDQIIVPHFSNNFESGIVAAVRSAFHSVKLAASSYADAETRLLKEIGLFGLTPNAVSTNIRSFSSTFAATGRLDAEHYQAKYEDLYRALASNNTVFRLGDRLSFNQRGSQPEYADAGLPVINSKHVQRGDVLIDDTRLAVSPDKDNSVFIEQGDVLMNGTGVGTIGRAAPYLHTQRALPDNHVTVLRTDAMSPICLALYLNSIAGQMQVDQYFKGSSGQIELYPADIANFWCPEIEVATQTKIDALAQRSFELKAKSERLLATAKRAVEVAIEQDEAAGMAYLERGHSV